MHALVDPTTGERLGTIAYDPYEVTLTETGEERGIGRYFEGLGEATTLDTAPSPEENGGTAEGEIPLADRPAELRQRVATIAGQRGLALVDAAETETTDGGDR